MQVRIKGYTFQLSEPYTEGCQLNLAEAQALNGLRAENVQNNLRKLVLDATAGLDEDTLLSDEALAEIQAKITRYELAYQFQERHQPKLRVGDIEAEARALAEARVDSEARLDGQELGSKLREARVAALEFLPVIIEEARVIVSARRKATQGGLDSL